MQSNRRFDTRLGMVAARIEHLQRVESYGMDRVELVIVPRDEEQAVRAHLERTAPALSVHCPLFRDSGPDGYPLLAAVFDTDPERSQRSITLIETELDRAARWGASHLVVHLQRAVAVLGETNPSGWTPERAVEAALEVGKRLAAAARGAGVELHLENMMGQPLLSRPEHYLAVLEPLCGLGVGMCFDVGHAALDAHAYGFDLTRFAALVAPHVGSIHLYNNQIHEGFDFGTLREQGRLRKVPVHPEQLPGQLWIDIPAVLGAILDVNPRALVTFEVYFALDTDGDATRAGMEWVADLCRPFWGPQTGDLAPARQSRT